MPCVICLDVSHEFDFAPLPRDREVATAGEEGGEGGEEGVLSHSY